MDFVRQYLDEVAQVARAIDQTAVSALVSLLVTTRELGGRLFVLGVGGSAANASHAVNDFRTIAGLEAYAPTDNVAELTARINDSGWDTCFANWLRASHLRSTDCLLILSVGGGRPSVSVNLSQAMKYAKSVGARIGGIVGRDGGATAKLADACVIVPTVHPFTVTPHTEAFQAVLWHLIVNHPWFHENLADHE